MGSHDGWWGSHDGWWGYCNCRSHDSVALSESRLPLQKLPQTQHWAVGEEEGRVFTHTTCSLGADQEPSLPLVGAAAKKCPVDAPGCLLMATWRAFFTRIRVQNSSNCTPLHTRCHGNGPLTGPTEAKWRAHSSLLDDWEGATLAGGEP